ncbi:MAG TPA: hypothetical protein GXX75_01735 [Clostridiales bacterium]|nr:hypothetical protein [Clostridiales bacterium]
MKITVYSAEIEISDWSRKLKIATIIFAAITAISSIILLFTKVVIPGLVPIALGCTTLLLGVKSFNVYFKRQKSKLFLLTGIVLTLIFACGLYIGIDQVITEFTKAIGL